MAKKAPKGMTIVKRTPSATQSEATQREEDAARKAVSPEIPAPAPVAVPAEAPDPRKGETKFTKTIRYSTELQEITKRLTLQIQMLNIDLNMSFDESMVIRLAVYDLACRQDPTIVKPAWMDSVQLP